MIEEQLGRQIPRDVEIIVRRMLGALPPSIDPTIDDDELPENATSAVATQSRRREETRNARATPAVDVPDGMPVPGGRVSSWFGMRVHPTLGVWKEHKGVDIACPIGTTVRAMADGKVSFAGSLRGYLQVIFLDHGNGFVTRYAHLSSIDVRVGELVARGAAIGASGTAGTGPHLHVEVLFRNHHVDPAPFLGVG